jgi:hypothetical protein
MSLTRSTAATFLIVSIAVGASAQEPPKARPVQGAKAAEMRQEREPTTNAAQRPTPSDPDAARTAAPPAYPRAEPLKTGSRAPQTVSVVDLGMAELQRLQRTLREWGYFKGDADGRPSRATTQALIQFYRAQARLAEQGKITPEGAAALGLDPGAIEHIRGRHRSDATPRTGAPPSSPYAGSHGTHHQTAPLQRPLDTKHARPATRD